MMMMIMMMIRTSRFDDDELIWRSKSPNMAVRIADLVVRLADFGVRFVDLQYLGGPPLS